MVVVGRPTLLLVVARACFQKQGCHARAPYARVLHYTRLHGHMFCPVACLAWHNVLALLSVRKFQSTYSGSSEVGVT
jgi:hypothetical protein